MTHTTSITMTDSLLNTLNYELGRPRECFADGAWQIGNIHASRYSVQEVVDTNGAVRTIWDAGTKKELLDALRALLRGVTLGKRYMTEPQ
jgi:hypothetical protein